jgi:hypothetical protein
MVEKKPIVIALGALGTIIFLAGLFTPLRLGEPHYAFFWALAFWAIAGMVQGFMKEEKRGEEGG